MTDHPNDVFWVTRDQTHIPVSMMTTPHILASLAKCQRDNWRTSYIPLFLSVLASRGLKDTHPELFI